MSFHSVPRPNFFLRSKARAVRSAAPVQPRRILIVEDQPVIRCALAKELALDGYDIAQAANATEAIALIGGGGTYELILTDIDMPGPFNGLQLAEFVKYVSPATCVIVMSGGAHAVDHLGAIDLFVAKPVPSAELRRQVANRLAGPTTR